MVNERGSILVGVLGLSMVMSMAAAGMLLVASNSRNDEDMAFRRAGCYLDAESGLIMGASWLRNHGSHSDTYITTNQAWPGNTLALQTGAVYDNGSTVTVTLVDNAPGSPTKTVRALAVRGSESMQFSWDIGVSGGTSTLPDLSLTDWRSP